MSAPVSASQLTATVEFVRARLKNRHQDRPVLIDADPASAHHPDIQALAHGDQPVHVSGTSSPLELSAYLAGRHPDQASNLDAPDVLLTDVGLEQLTTDILHRVAGDRRWAPNRWDTVRQLFGVEQLSRALTSNDALVDALIEHAPLNGYPTGRSPILQLDTAVDALTNVFLGIGPGLDLAGLIVWASTGDAPHRLRQLDSELGDILETSLTDRLGAGTGPVLHLTRIGRSADLIPVSLAAAAIHHPAADANTAIVPIRLLDSDDKIGRTFTPAAWIAAGAAAAQLVTDQLASANPSSSQLTSAHSHTGQLASAHSHTGQLASTHPGSAQPGTSQPSGNHLASAQATGALQEAEGHLARYEATQLAQHCDLIPSGADGRLGVLADALTQMASHPDPASTARIEADHDVDRLAAWAGAHRFADQARITRARHAARMIRRGATEPAWGDRLATAAATYRTETAWWDRARTDVSRSDTHPQLAALYGQLTTAANTARHQANRTFAHFAREAASPLTGNLIGVEDVLGQVVAPLAAGPGVVLLVLDGLSWPTFTEIDRHISARGWAAWANPAASRSLLAVLPTITKLSRSSLLAGEICEGTSDTEQSAFVSNDALTAACGTTPPVLFHKNKLRGGGLDSEPTEITDAIANPTRRCVGVVLNNIDERLKDVAQPPGGWGFDELHPLRALLDAARAAGKAVVITSDHGHILARNPEKRDSGGGGERWRAGSVEPADDEVRVHGPRVATPDRAAVLPWIEQVHYGATRNGYHGGFTPQEVLIPLAVYAPQPPDDGWDPVAFAPPAWWHPASLTPDTAEAPPTPPKRPRTRKKPTPDTIPMFEAPPAPEPPATATATTVPSDTDPPAAGPSDTGPNTAGHTTATSSAGADWIDRALAELDPDSQPRIRLSTPQVASLLRALDRHGGQALHLERLADQAGLSQARIRGAVSQLQNLVNIDGSPIVEVSGEEVRFDAPELRHQLGLAP